MARTTGGFILIAGAMLLSASPAFAYIDPNTGGLISQILAPLFAAFAGFWLIAKERISIAVKRLVQYVALRISR